MRSTLWHTMSIQVTFLRKSILTSLLWTRIWESLESEQDRKMISMMSILRTWTRVQTSRLVRFYSWTFTTLRPPGCLISCQARQEAKETKLNSAFSVFIRTMITTYTVVRQTIWSPHPRLQVWISIGPVEASTTATSKSTLIASIALFRSSEMSVTLDLIRASTSMVSRRS